MNQILYTGKSKKKSSTNSIVIFFSIFIAIFAICMIALGIFLFTRTKTEEGNNQNNIGGNTTGGQTQQEEPQGNIEISITSTVGGIKIVAQSDNEIQTATYKWDNGEEVQIEIGENATSIEHEVAISQGTHMLSVTVTDNKGISETMERKVIGATEPTVTIGTDGVSKFVIKATDEEQLKKLTIILNEETIEVPIEETEYEYSIDIPEGDSYIKVTVENKNGLTAVKEAQVKGFTKR